MKQIDQFLIKSFVPPFFVAFAVTLFVLIMQFLWKYIDDIIGKGLDIAFIFELIFYRSTSFIPMALPMAVLISSVMVMGGLAERYELASFKSAGISLERIMRPLMLVAILVAGGSYITANYLIPISNLKFKSRLFDIRNQKPTLSIAPGEFNEDFKNIIIRVGEKEDDNKTIRDVLIYDHTSRQGNDNQIIAESGEMYTTEDKQFFIIKLSDGHQYQDLESAKKNDSKFPFIRTNFKTWEKVFDLNEFAMNETDQDLFKKHHSMLSRAQLQSAVDSLEIKIADREQSLSKYTKAYFQFQRGNKDTASFYSPICPTEILPDSLLEYTSFSEYLLATNQAKERLFEKGISFARNNHSHALSIDKSTESLQYSIVMHLNELHRKYSMAVACFLFLFIGAPLGAIIRKGGFGWPLLVSIAFFVAFIMCMIFGEKLSKEMIVSPFIGMWLPCLIIFPLGLLLTYKALNDSKLLDFKLPFTKKKKTDLTNKTAR